MPFIRGMLMSVMMRYGRGSSCSISKASTPSRAIDQRVRDLELVERPAERLDVDLVILDEKDRYYLAASHACVSTLDSHRLIFLPLKLENCASTRRRRLEPDAAALPLDDAAHDRQSHAATLDLIAGFQCLKHLEYALRILRRYTLAIVRDGEDVVVSLLLAGDDDAALRPRVMLDGIADEIPEYLLERRRMGLERG